MADIIDPAALGSLREMVDKAAEEYSSAPFATYKTEDGITSKTYGEFRRDTRAIASYLVKRGLGGAHAALIAANSYEWLAAFFGTVSAGAAVVPLNIGETVDALERLTLFADCEVVFFDEKRRAVAERLKNSGMIKLFVSVDDNAAQGEMDLSELFAESETELPPVGPDDLCSIVYTSGTTGMPKGVMLTHKNYIYSALSVHVACPTKSLLCVLPLSHAFCFTAVITKGIVKGKEIFMNDSFDNLMANIRLFRPESMAVVPQIAKKLMFGALKFAGMHPEMSEQAAVKAFFGGNIIDIISGGAPLESELAIRFEKTGVLVLNGYGMTECAPIISNNATYQHRAGSVGKPIPCMEVVVRDSQILVKGPSVFKGYYKNPEETAAAFTEDGYFKTGDTGYFDNDGYLYLNGRVKNLILLDNGENVSAEQLEALFGYEKLVKEVVCYGEGNAIVAEIFPDRDFISAEGIGDLDAYMLDMLQRVNSRLAVFQRISKYVLRDAPFPKNASMKIKRGGPHGTAAEKKEPGRTDTEKKIIAAVKELLGADDVGRDDNFFALGGSSLNAAELAAGLNIPVELIYENPFISVLAGKLEEKADTSEKPEDLSLNGLIPAGKAPKSEKPVKTVFLTGATGFLGVHVLAELFKREIKTYALVRNTEKFRKTLARYFPDIPADTELIVPLVGNIEKDRLGLTQELFDRLTAETDAVFHCAASVLHAGDYELSHRTNVLGSLNAAKLALAADCPFEYCSTVSLHGAGTVRERRKNPVFDEDTLYIGQIYADNVYIHSKFEAERELLKLKADGLKLNIFRMGNLTWRQSDGMFQKNAADNGFLHRLRAILKPGTVNDMSDKYPIDLTPIDRSAQAVAALALGTGTGEIYHIINPYYVPTERLFELTGRAFRRVSACESIETVAANSADRDISVWEFYSIVAASSDEVELKCDKTLDVLREVGFEWDDIDADYLAKAGELLDVSGFTPESPQNDGKLNHIQRLFLGKLADAKTRPQKTVSGAGSVARLKETLPGAHKPFVITFPQLLENGGVKAALDA
ncbi:MAG: AMP-binding protein, partial [Clostridia bacterium]|nr:AMP-binding protein [Clostridia bacterium]